jgi:hypothetical protein
LDVVKNCWLWNAYLENPEFSLAVGHLLVFNILPPDNFMDAWHILCQKFQNFDEDGVQELMDYMYGAYFW